jgi:glyoxylase-like metal-dependent hydrolase (beta-lactamase superfamily II)
MAVKRGREHLRCPTQGLLGVGASEVRDVIITHLHYDHVGNFAGH